MENKNIIGLEVENSNHIAEALNELLANHQIYYQNLRGFHWLILGKNFFQLHEKYEALYNEAADTIDEIAERILMIGGTPLHTFEGYLEIADLKSAKDIRSSKESLDVVEQNVLFLTNSIRTILKQASKNNDEGTVAIMGELISRYEKQLWMLSAYNATID
ncbi:MAG: DNA starvation/stationary phase protection protein [Melioribacteraceae bacterium]|nr:DNA starvation/stationary phase protection protein [Melioribacteraceae bacterium]